MSVYVSSAERRKADTPSSRWVGFELNGQGFGVKIEQVREVLSNANIEPVPGSPPLVLGVINLRGRIVTVLDLHLCLGLVRASEAETRMIIVDLDGEPIALRVDRISDLCAVPENAVKEAPATARGGANAAVCGVVNKDNGMLTLLDLGRLLKTAA
jgi:purine-binding chemotaxis protein CheW